MTKYLFKRILHGLLSVVAVVMLVMILIFVAGNALGKRDKIFREDDSYKKKLNSIGKKDFANGWL